MPAEVQQIPTLTETTTQSITVNFDPTAPPSSQFTFDTSTGKPYLFVDESTTISVQLVAPAGAEFAASGPINWVLVPKGLTQPDQPVPSSDGSISFPISPAQHHFVPWVFSFNINYNGLSNINSPLVFLVKHFDQNPLSFPLQLTLAYTAADGSFNLLDGVGTDMPAALLLSSTEFLINVIPASLMISITGAKFGSSPIVWSSGEKPGWITPPLVTDDVLTFSVPDATTFDGRSTGLQFAVVVKDDQGQDVTILSPDPILINATIGDGGG